jgi:hypothetical protein
MYRRHSYLVVAATALAFGLVTAPAAQERSVERGKQLFYVHGCYGCHGFNGETGAQDLVGTGSPIVSNEALFISFLRLRADQAPVLPTTRMPNYPENSLSDDEAKPFCRLPRKNEAEREVGANATAARMAICDARGNVCRLVCSDRDGGARAV